MAFLLRIWFAHGLPMAVRPPTLPVAASSLFFVHRQCSEAESPAERLFSCCASSPWWFSSAEGSFTSTLPAVCPEELSLCRKFPSLHTSPAMWKAAVGAAWDGRETASSVLVPAPQGPVCQAPSAWSLPSEHLGLSSLVHRRHSLPDTSKCISNPVSKRTPGFSAALF